MVTIVTHGDCHNGEISFVLPAETAGCRLLQNNEILSGIPRCRTGRLTVLSSLRKVACLPEQDNGRAIDQFLHILFASDRQT